MRLCITPAEINRYAQLFAVTGFFHLTSLGWKPIVSNYEWYEFPGAGQGQMQIRDLQKRRGQF